MEVRNGQCFYCTQWSDGIAFIVTECFAGPQLRHLHEDAATALLSTDKSPVYEFMGFGAHGPLKDGLYKEHIKF